MTSLNHVVTGANGIALRAREWGSTDNATVVLVHGYPDNSDVWTAVVDRLREDFHVVSYDVRGAGQSEPGEQFGGYALKLLSQDLAAVIDQIVPAGRKVHLVAHDWGAIQSWESVLDPTVSQRIASYTFFGAPCLDHASHWLRSRVRPHPRRLTELAGQLTKSWYVAGFHLPFAAPFLWRNGLDRVLPAAIGFVDKLPADLHPELLASDGEHGVELYRANFIPKLLRPSEGRTDIPVQAVITDGDWFVSTDLFAETVKRVPNLWRRDLRGGHWINRSHPDQVAAWVAEFARFVDNGVETAGLRRARIAAAAKVTKSQPFAGQLALVTGAGSGIGRETALAFARGGADVIAVDRDGEAAAETAAMIGPAASAMTVDVSDRAAMEQMAKSVQSEIGVPDIVVNNAGIGLAGPFLETTVEDWQRVLDVNLWGVIHGSRLFAQMMVDAGKPGHIVNLASMAAYVPSRSLSAYCTSKAAVLMLSDCMRADLASDGIKVTAICPGIVNTNITKTTQFAGSEDDLQSKQQAKTSALYERRNFTPDRVARDIVEAVLGNEAVVPVTVEAKLARLMSRISPSAMSVAAKFDPLPH